MAGGLAVADLKGLLDEIATAQPAAKR